MANWDEFRTAFHVARFGTVSGAANALGVHHATVIRHVDALEERLGTKLFQRHARGYTPTEAGQDLLLVAQTTEDQFQQLEGRLKGRGTAVEGELVVTSIPGLSGLMTPILTSFQQDHPGLSVRYITSDRLFRLEYGEAHVAIRAGRAPQEPDNVVQRFGEMQIGLFATQEYLDRSPAIIQETDLAQHNFVVEDGITARAPFYQWLFSQVSHDRAVFRVSESHAVIDAVRCGAGLGFLARWAARDIPGLVEVLPSRKDWAAPMWLVTHVDLHRTAKVQSFLTHLKLKSADWDI